MEIKQGNATIKANIIHPKQRGQKLKRLSEEIKRRNNFFLRRLNFFFRPFVEKELFVRYMKRVIAVSITKIRLFNPAKSRQRLYCEPSDLSVETNNAASGSNMRLFHESE